MFTPWLNLSASTYEAIIAAFIVVGLIQSFALRRVARQRNAAKQAVSKIITASISTVTALIGVVGKAQAEARKAKRQLAEVEREAMSALADADDELADVRGSGVDRDAPNQRRPDLATLFSLLDPRWRGRTNPIDALLFGGPGPDVVRSFRVGRDGALNPLGGSFAHGGEVPVFSLDDIRRAVNGDTSALERSTGAVPGSVIVDVVGPDGKTLPPEEARSLLDEFLASNNGAEEARRDFGPDSGGDPLSERFKASVTQEPVDSRKWTGRDLPGEEAHHSDSYQSPRAG